MEDSLKGILVTATIITLFITCIVNFIVLFPQEQGVVFSDGEEQESYLTIAPVNDSGTVSSLTSINNQSEDAFNKWDVTTGFMGTNQLKQGQGGVKTFITSIFTNLSVFAKQLFGSGSPIVYAITIISTLSLGYLVYMTIKFVRSGQ